MRTILYLLILGLINVNLIAKEIPSIEKPKKGEIYLNFEDASLANVVQYLAEKKKIDLIPHKDLEAQKITLTTRTPFTLEKAWDILLTLLAASNFTMIEVDNVYRIVPNGEKKQNPLPSYIGVDPENLPDSDLTIRYVYLFKNAKSENVKPILDVLLSNGSVQYSDNLNACIITEKCLSIKSAMKVISELDRGGLRESIQILKLKEADAEVVAKTFNEGILGVKEEKRNIRFLVPPKKQATYFSARTKLIPDTRNNALIMLGTNDELQKVRAFINKYIDISIESPRSRLHIKELKYARAEKLKPLLDAVIKPPLKDKKSALIGQVKYFEDMVISSEAAEESSGEKVGTMGSGNRLLIACNRDDWIRIEKFIDRLDKPQPQVAMEVLFVDVALEDSRKLGAQLRNKASVLGKHINAQTQHIIASPSDFTNVSHLRSNMVETVVGNQLTENAAFLTLGRDSDVHAVLKSVLKSENSNIISQPYLVASNHQKCKLLISETRNVEGSASGESTSAVRKREDVEAKTSVEITPGINSNGVITLKINISIDEFLQSSVDDADKTNRSISTLATMLDGEVLVIGGLTKSKSSDTTNKTPGLSKIPIIGSLFRNKNRTLNKADLHIFIRPTLIKPKFEGKPGDYTQLKLDYARLAIKRAKGFADTKDPVQKWFFHGDPQKPTRSLANATSDEIDQVNNYVMGKKQPRSVIVPIDDFYKTKTSRTITRFANKAKEEQKRRKKKSLTK